VRIDPKVEDEIKAVVEQLNALRSDDRAYDISDVVPADGGWNLKLFAFAFRSTPDMYPSSSCGAPPLPRTSCARFDAARCGNLTLPKQVISSAAQALGMPSQ
jgi:hypothetical protein